MDHSVAKYLPCSGSEHRRIISAYILDQETSFHKFDDGSMEIEYRGEGEVIDMKGRSFTSVRKVPVRYGSEKYRELMNEIKDFVEVPPLSYNKYAPKLFQRKE